jgi:hypothetical protein
MSAAPAAALAMMAAERATLEVLARSRSVSCRQVLRARALLLAGDGGANTGIAVEVGVRPVTVRGLASAFRRGRVGRVGDDS